MCAQTSPANQSWDNTIMPLFFLALTEARLTLQKTRDTMQHFRTSSLDCGVGCHYWEQEQ